jgi:Flp pilus assembly protein TadG
MNRRGQALIEFVLILPVIIFIVFAVFDFGMIFSKQNSLQNDSTDIVVLYKSGSSLDEIRNKYSDIEITTMQDGNFEKIIVSSQIKLITPGFNLIFGNPYRIVVERYINYE